MAEPAAAFSFKAKARFADNLYRARERAGLSQKDAAARAAVTRARLDKIEGGDHPPLRRSDPPCRRLLDVGWRACRGRHLEAGLGRRLRAGRVPRLNDGLNASNG
jgi:transcriptional regulator with XRE-family HTH domain